MYVGVSNKVLESLTFYQRLQLLVILLGYPEHDTEDGEGVLSTIPHCHGLVEVLSVLCVEVHHVQLKRKLKNRLEGC